MGTRATPTFGAPKPRERVQIDPQAAATRAVQGSSAPQADHAAEEQVRVSVPHAFKLTTDDHLIYAYGPETSSMPRSHAAHPYSADNGVRLVD